MDGYDLDFLPIPLPLPDPPADARQVRLDYLHFSVLMDVDRRLAALTAVNIDGARLVDVERTDDWHLDPRLPEEQQCGPELYARNDIDRGHLVRRRDPVWGGIAEAARASADTFAYTNAAPQAAEFNQSKELWLGLEDFVLDNADLGDRRMTVFTGPVFSDDDPVYRGVRIPLMFWKIAAWVSGDRLAATAYLLDQAPQLGDLDRTIATADAPELGPYRTYQVAVSEIGALTGLDVAQLAAADRLGVPATARVGTPEDGRDAWVELERYAAITL
ncbi:DNA/RNA non-specific endonuclease [Clavibacter michiganensis]|uniref:DNA/RNA non-specific endonuclease n=1 Tax=Clavibacter michiganensis TaxID=28447 RepID=UPI001BE01349|nr:DNA/RNA non-specific endonuclease [Clavibacter michiganensis]MBT1635277.1 DNA/RNA non-specific endonuclease [Clavibacter michiganensis]